MRLLSSFLIMGTLLLCSCQHASDAWEGTKTASRYLERKGRSLFSKDSDSQLVKSNEEFYGPGKDDFIPMNEKDLHISATSGREEMRLEEVFNIHKFKEPSGQLTHIFRNVYFNTDEHVLNRKEYLNIVQGIADYLKQHPHSYIYIEGHCDLRAAQSYNLPLGTRRANSIKTLLVKAGVKPEQIFTISYGKERLLLQGHSPEAHAKNRRVQFKIFESSSTK